MEEKDENSLRAYKQTEDDLEGKGQFFEVGAGGSESKSPTKSQQQRQSNCNEEVLPRVFFLTLVDVDFHSHPSANQLSHYNRKDNPVEYVYDGEWQDVSQPKWPLCCPAAEH